MTDTRDDYDGHDQKLSEVIYEDEVKGLQVRLTVSEFRGNYYIGLRKWFMDLEEDWYPTKQGFSWSYNLMTTSNLFSAVTKILSKAEVLHEVLDKLDYDYESYKKKEKDDDDSNGNAGTG